MTAYVHLITNHISIQLFAVYSIPHPKFDHFAHMKGAIKFFGSCTELMVQRMSLLTLGISQRQVSPKTLSYPPALLPLGRPCRLYLTFNNKEALIS